MLESSLQDVNIALERLFEVLLQSLEFLQIDVAGSGAFTVAQDAFDAGCSDWVVEVLVLLEPGAAGIVLTGILEGGVHRREVFRAAHRRDPLLGWRVDWIVEEAEAGWVPALANLWVDILRAVKVSIDAREDGCVYLIVVGLEGVMEDDLEVRVVTEVLGEVFGRGCTV